MSAYGPSFLSGQTDQTSASAMQMVGRAMLAAADPMPSDTDIDVRQALLRLRRKDRDLLVEVYINGRSNAELATELGVSPEAARQRLSRAARRLRRELGEAYTDTQERP